MCQKLESNPKLGLVFPDYFLIDSLGEVIAEEQRHAFDKEVSLLDQPAHGACTMIRRSFLEKLGGYNESFLVKMDMTYGFVLLQNIKSPTSMNPFSITVSTIVT